MPCCFHVRLYTCLDVLSIWNFIFSVLNLLGISLALSATAHPWLTKQKSHEIFRFTASTVDIPSRWDPQAKQSRTVALLAALCAAALFEPLPSCWQKEKPEHKRVLVFLGAPNHENPNLFSIGEGFGFFVFFGNENSGSSLTAVCPKPYQKKDRITKVTTVKVP